MSSILCGEKHSSKSPPQDHTAYPSLQEAINPHIESFNAVFEEEGLLDHGLEDIGPRYFLDGSDTQELQSRNVLRLQIKKVYLSTSMLSANNKFSTKNREIMPAECRERHCTYRGKLMAKLEYQINNQDPVEFYRDLGQLPIMVKVRMLVPSL